MGRECTVNAAMHGSTIDVGIRVGGGVGIVGGGGDGNGSSFGKSSEDVLGWTTMLPQLL